MVCYGGINRFLSGFWDVLLLFSLPCSSGTQSSGPAAIGAPNNASRCQSLLGSFTRQSAQPMGAQSSERLHHWTSRNTSGRRGLEKRTTTLCSDWLRPSSVGTSLDRIMKDCNEIELREKKNQPRQTFILYIWKVCIYIGCKYISFA